LAELIAAIAREDVDNIAEEMGDVKNMLNQLEIIYGNAADVEFYRVNKLKRAEYRMRGEDMVRRRCPKCGKYCYSSESSREFWSCPNCKYEIPKECQESIEEKVK
jgi:ssDNA-binding Zn-finger/Zn-ribbon topoisomerase 1